MHKLFAHIKTDMLLTISFNRMFLSLFFIFVLSSSFKVLLANDDPGLSISGAWSVECDNFTVLNIDSTGQFGLNVNDNQIYINGTIKKAQVNEYYLYYEGPADLGRGGMTLHWGRFSKTKPIARLSVLHSNTLIINWYGFYDEVDHNFVWTTQPDFLNERNKKIIMKRCSTLTQR